MARLVFITTLFFVTTFPILAQAAQLPRFLGTERKFRSFVFNPNEVYRYIGHYTYQGFIEFSEGENISTISMGNPSLWIFEHLGNRLFLKPVGEDNSETNMTVITNKNVYNFELLAKEAKGIADKDLVFVAKFVYPDDKDKNLVEFQKTPPSDEPDLRDLSIYNFNYQYTGEPNIAPLKVFDNGEFTYFQFSKKNAEVPAIFSVDPQGFESLVNFRSAGNYIITERVGAQFTLRNGAEIVCVYNMNMYNTGQARELITENRNPKKPSPAQMSQPFPAHPETANTNPRQSAPTPAANLAPDQNFMAPPPSAPAASQTNTSAPSPSDMPQGIPPELLMQMMSDPRKPPRRN